MFSQKLLFFRILSIFNTHEESEKCFKETVGHIAQKKETTKTKNQNFKDMNLERMDT